MSIKAVNYKPPCPVRQDDLVLSQANPVSGTEYEVMPATLNVRLIGAYAKVTWTVQPNPLQMHITQTAVVSDFNMANPVSNTNYFVNFPTPETASTTQVLNATGYLSQNYAAFIMEDRRMSITAETTGGTVSALDARVKYSKW